MEFGHSLPHHRLRIYATALSLLRAVQDARLRDRELRTPALRAAKSLCLNIAEGAGRVTRADKARAYTVARGELVEAVAASEIALASGDVEPEPVARVLTLGAELYAALSKLVHCVTRAPRVVAAAPALHATSSPRLSEGTRGDTVYRGCAGYGPRAPE